MKIVIVVDVGDIPEGAGPIKVDEVHGLIKQSLTPAVRLANGYTSISTSYEMP